MSKAAPDLPAAARPLARLLEHPRWSRRERFGRFLDDVLAGSHRA